ncbi:MAG: DUF2911 domain-containing protein [Bacteroidota bacterium]|nr:DUF2911 domain-containing protein [Bacteroidota bacterium]
MKRQFILCLFTLATTIQYLAAQDIELPRLSPKASVSYTIGLTDVEVHYGAPAVKGRTVWGGLVPFGKVWRGGANEATTIEFSTDVNVEGQNLKAGKYSLFFIPDSTEWTVIFNKKTDLWGAFSYSEADDALRITVTPKMNEGMQERLAYTIHDMKMDMGYVKLSWEKMRLYIRFKVDIMEKSIANIMGALEKSAEDKKWVVYAQGAQFLLDAEGDAGMALDWAKKSTERFTHSWNLYIQAQAEARKGDYAAAVATGTKSAENGLANVSDHFYEDNKDEVNTAIKGWAAKMN